MASSPNSTTDASNPLGYRAWLAAWLGLVVLFVAFGVAYSFGVFLPALIDEFDINRGGASLFFSFTTFLFFGLGILTGPLSDRLGTRLFIVAGGLCIAVGLWVTATAHSLVQAYIGYGAGIGLGVSCLFVPVVAAVTRHFGTRRSLALGITVSGIGLGTLIVAPVSESLIEALGWRETYRVYAVVSVVVLVIAGLLFPAPPRATAQAGRMDADRRGASPGGRYPRFYLATIIVNLAMYVPFAHLPAAAQAGGISSDQSAQVLGLLGLTSVASRLLIGAMGARFDEWRLYRLCIVCVAASFVLWGLAGSFAVYLFYAMVGGFGYGGYIALTPAVLAREFPAARPGYLMGLTYTAVAIGASVGPVSAGLLAQWLGGYEGPLFILAALTALGLIPLAVFPAKHACPAMTHGTVSQRSGSRRS
jgi:MFS family permease